MELMATEQREQIGRIQKLVAYSRPGTGTGNLHVLVGREPGFDHCSDSQLLSENVYRYKMNKQKLQLERLSSYHKFRSRDSAFNKFSRPRTAPAAGETEMLRASISLPASRLHRWNGKQSQRGVNEGNVLRRTPVVNANQLGQSQLGRRKSGLPNLSHIPRDPAAWTPMGRHRTSKAGALSLKKSQETHMRAKRMHWMRKRHSASAAEVFRTQRLKESRASRKSWDHEMFEVDKFVERLGTAGEWLRQRRLQVAMTNGR
jgi:hypothetical protein